MTGRRRRPGDEFADDYPWTPGEQPDGYPRDDGTEPPWSPAEEPRREGRRGRHSAAPPPVTPPPAVPHQAVPPEDPHSRPGRPGMAAPPPRGRAGSGQPPLPRQPGQRDQGYPQPGANGAPTARYPVQRGGRPAGPPPYPGQAGNRSAPNGRPSVPGGRSPLPGGGPPYPGARPSGGGIPDRGQAGSGPYPGVAGRLPRGRGEYPPPGEGYPAGGSPGRAGGRDDDNAAGRDRYGAGGEYGAPGDSGARRARPGYGAPGAPDGYSAPGAPDGHGARGTGAASGYGAPDGQGAPDGYRDDGFWAPDDRDPAAGRGGYDDRDDRPVRPKRRHRGRWAALIAVLVIVVPLAVAAFFAYRAIAGHYFPADYSGAGTGKVVAQIHSGDSATVIGDRLFTLGVVASSRAFVLAAEASPKASSLQPGFYLMHEHMNATLAFNLLLKPSARIQHMVTIPEGLRESQILAALGQSSGIPVADYKKALRNTAALGLPSYARGNPEGYLFPATYAIQPHMTAAGVLQAMVQSFNAEAASVNLAQAAGGVHLTPAQVIVVASLAQAEGGKVSDFPKIARVIYNRLHAGMKLQFDSTVLYGLHAYGIRASSQQLNSNSPYNTYKYAGLPPGPIDSPGDAAIRAALHPAAGNWLYFVTVNPKTKQTDFTSSYAVFQQLSAQLNRNQAG